MIISASRRTDIPAFYSEWFVNRLKAGYAYTKNPMNPTQISKISLNTEVVDCIVFWTKNAAPIMDKLATIDSMGYPYYFQWTITPYGRDVEPNLPDKAKVIESFQALSNKIGRQRIIWRYDPVIVSPQFTVEYHVQNFAKMCHLLRGYTTKCIFSYVDLYAKISKRAHGIVNSETDIQTMLKLAKNFSEIAKSNNISLETCAEQIELSQFGIRHSSCISKKTVENIIGYSLDVKQDENQRPHCGCMESIDIGVYDSCSHGCVYCYATSNVNIVFKNMKSYDNQSPLLLGNPCPGDKITVRAVKSLKTRQTSLY